MNLEGKKRRPSAWKATTATAHASWRITKTKLVVLYSYPADDTPGCTKEACELSRSQRQHKNRRGRARREQRRRGIAQEVYGEINLPFVLLSDPNLECDETVRRLRQEVMCWHKRYREPSAPPW